MERLIYCTINKEPTPNPVICSKTGYAFDKDTIRIYLEKSKNECPITKIPLKFPEDFIEMKGLKGPTLSNNTTISRSENIEKIIDNYKEITEEAKTYKKTINLLKEKLTSSLKRQKSALSLIKLLKRERDDARKKLSSSEYELNDVGVEKVRETEDDEKLSQEISNNSLRLNKVRKEMAKVYKNEESILKKNISQLTVKSLEAEIPYFNNYDFDILSHPFNNDVYIASDKRNLSFVFDFEKDTVKKIYDISFDNCDHFLTSSALTPDSDGKIGYIMARNDGNLVTGILDSQDGKGNILRTKNLHTNFIDLREHPINKYLIGLDKLRNLSLYDIKQEIFIFNHTIEEDLEIGRMNVHPDGKLVALAGSENNLHFFDLTSNQVVLTLEALSVNN